MPPPLQDARNGLALLKTAIVEFIREHPKGVTNADVADGLELRSDYEGENKDFLSWAVIGLLLAEGRVRYERRGRSKVYFLQNG